MKYGPGGLPFFRRRGGRTRGAGAGAGTAAAGTTSTCRNMGVRSGGGIVIVRGGLMGRLEGIYGHYHH